MKAVLDFVANHGPTLLLGTTLLLTLALVLVFVHQQPIHRQRIAESSMVLCVLFLILACIPLPRFSFEKKAPLAPRPLPLYTLQPGDEVIAAEVFRVKRESGVPGSTGIGVPLPMPPTLVPPGAVSSARTPEALRRNWGIILARVYAGGVVACILYSVLGHLLLHRLVAGSQAADFASEDKRVRVRISPDCDRPLSFGLFWPTILLPARFTELDRTKQQHILLHELAHISQRDALGHFLFNLMFPILHFHPLYWLLRWKTNLAREMIADDWASALTSRESYVADLLALAKERFGRGAMSAQALGLFQSKTDLYRRMHMLMQTNQPLERQCSIHWRLAYSTLLVMALIAVSGTFGLRRANAQAQVDDAQKVAAARLAEEQSVAAQRQDELAKLRAQQDQIKAQLAALEAEKAKLMAELAQRKDEGAKANDAAAKRNEAARFRAALEEKIDGQKEKAAAERDKAVNADRQAMRDWMEKKNVGGNRDQNEFPGRAHLDLVSLANSYVDAIGNLQVAQLELERISGKEKVFTQYEVNKAKVDVVTAERKVRIFRAIAEAALESAKSDLDFAVAQVQNGIAPQTTMSDAKSRLRILEVILAQ
jgi:hypothetical protein